MSRASLKRKYEEHWEEADQLTNFWLQILIEHGDSGQAALAKALLDARDKIGEAREMLVPIKYQNDANVPSKIQKVIDHLDRTWL